MSERIDLDELDKTCRAATPGVWSTTKPPLDVDGWQLGVCVAGTLGGRIYSTTTGGQFPAADAMHIAACDPGVVGGLIDRIRELEAMLGRANDYVNPDVAPFTADDVVDLLVKGAVRRG